MTDSPGAVGQAVYTRLRLQQGELFFDTSAGVPYAINIIGYGDKRDKDAIIMATILGTTGVVSLDAFDSIIDNATRRYGFTATITSLYGVTTLSS